MKKRKRGGSAVEVKGFNYVALRDFNIFYTSLSNFCHTLFTHTKNQVR